MALTLTLKPDAKNWPTENQISTFLIQEKI